MSIIEKRENLSRNHQENYIFGLRSDIRYLWSKGKIIWTSTTRKWGQSPSQGLQKIDRYEYGCFFVMREMKSKWKVRSLLRITEKSSKHDERAVKDFSWNWDNSKVGFSLNYDNDGSVFLDITIWWVGFCRNR